MVRHSDSATPGVRSLRPAPRVAVLVGTRPDAIKLAPVVRALRRRRGLKVVLLSTGQHRELLDQALAVFDLQPDHDLQLMAANQLPEELAARSLGAMTAWLRTHDPQLLVVQGDTTTAMTGALAAGYAGLPVAHVEAGLRSYDLTNPYPEEMNRRIVSLVARLHFAPTESNRRNLLAEGVPGDRIFVTGNTVIDALRLTARRLSPRSLERVVPGLAGRRVVLVTLHRRESFGQPLEGICSAVRRLANARRDLRVLLPVHPNPQVSDLVRRRLGRHPRIHLVTPLDYPEFVAAMKYSTLILTDSGGVQEEAPSLGKPVLILRDVTERPEGVEAGVAVVVGRDPDQIFESALRLLDDPAAYQAMARRANPYGDGKAAPRIAREVSILLSGKG